MLGTEIKCEQNRPCEEYSLWVKVASDQIITQTAVLRAVLFLP